MKKKRTKNIILFVGKPTSETLLHLAELREKGVAPYSKARFARIRDGFEVKKMPAHLDLDIIVDFDNSSSIEKGISEIKENILCVTCRAEAHIPHFAQLIPHLKGLGLNLPDPSSLIASTDKLVMRKEFRDHEPSITPKFSIAPDATKETILKIEKKLGYPMIVKPVGLAQSLLVTIAYHRDELEKALKTVLKNISQVSDRTKKKGRQVVLVEQFLEGDQYSIDAYVNSKGRIRYCPIVYVKTGRSIGFDDFFGYQQMTPTKLLSASVKSAETVASESIRALGLTSSSAHVELLRTEDKGWKVIEVGPRVGGFRDSLYGLSYGIDHTRNDIEVRIDKKLRIPKRIKGYSAAMKIYSPKEGVIKSIIGIKKIQKLESFDRFEMGQKSVGDKAVFAKNGGSSVFNVILFNKNRSDLLADIRRLEKTVEIKVSKK